MDRRGFVIELEWAVICDNRPCNQQHPQQNSHHISPGSETVPQSAHPSPGVQPDESAKDSALQKALQQPAVWPRTGSQPEMGNSGKPADCKALRESAARGERAVSGSVVPTGFEPGDVTPSVPGDLRQTSNQRAAECAAVGDDFPPLDPELASVIEAWPTLPPAIRTAILAIVEAAHRR